MSYQDFTRDFTRKMGAEGEEYLLGLLQELFLPAQQAGGTRYDCRRISDELIDEERRIVRTQLFCFPADAGKGRMQQGGYLVLDAVCEDPQSPQPRFTSLVRAGFLQPGKKEIYYAVVAARARGQLEQEGERTFLHHDVMITTPEKRTIALEDFDFSRHDLFMLGLVSGEYRVSIRRR